MKDTSVHLEKKCIMLTTTKLDPIAKFAVQNNNKNQWQIRREILLVPLKLAFSRETRSTQWASDVLWTSI